MKDYSLHLAKQELRFANSVIDMIAIFVLWILVSTLLILLGFDLHFEQITADANEEKVSIIPYVIFIPIFWSYYLFTEHFYQRTLGKLLTRTRVVTKTGDKPTFGQILGRTLCRSIPFEYFSYLGSVNGIHDMLSGTRVIKE